MTYTEKVNEYYASVNEGVWQGAFPGVDVGAEFKKAKMWLLSNPKRRKKNFDRFMFNWLSNSKPISLAEMTPEEALRRTK